VTLPDQSASVVYHLAVYYRDGRNMRAFDWPDDAMVERLRDSLWSTWGRNRQTTDWPSREQLRAALEAAFDEQRGTLQAENELRAALRQIAEAGESAAMPLPQGMGRIARAALDEARECVACASRPALPGQSVCQRCADAIVPPDPKPASDEAHDA
jgi:hypothetical protein